MVTEELLDLLAAEVGKRYAETGEPLLLSRFGQANRELLAELKAEFGTLYAAVKTAGDRRLHIVDDRIGRESMVPAGVAPEAEAKVRETVANQRQDSSNFASLPSAVKIAFCVRTEAGEHVAIRLSPPFQYEKLSSVSLLRPGFRIIPERYRKPGLALHKISLADGEALWRAFVAWAESEQLDPATFASGKQTNALARFLAAQPPDIMHRLVIPADIAALLLKRP